MNPPGVHVVFVVPFFMTATLRFVAGAAALPGVRLSLISQDPLEKLPADLRGRIVGHWRVEDCMRSADLVGATRELGRRFGAVARLIGSLEQLQVPLAEASVELGLPGLTPTAARNFRDKQQMKDVFDAAGLPCARHALVADAADARRFAAACGYPLIAKPLAGAGGRNTFRLNDGHDLDAYLRTFAPSVASPVLFEEFLSGTEHSFDAVMLHGRLVWHSISIYSPSPLTVMENPWIQWCVLLPRDIGAAEYRPIEQAAARALEALGLVTGMVHMEWFRRPDGSIAISEVAARPPGAQFTTLISLAHGQDFYRAWPRLMIFDQFEIPPRRFAAGAAYLRGMGTGRVREVQGVDIIQREFGELIVETKWPEPGVTQPTGYEGAGYVLFRHPDTQVVERALRRTVEVIRVILV